MSNSTKNNSIDGPQGQPPKPDSQPGLTRRQVMGLVPLLLALLAASSPAQQLGISEDQPGAEALTPAALAWSKVPESERSEYYLTEGWKDFKINGYEISQAGDLRNELSRLYLYRQLCHPPHPLPASKWPVVEINQRAALHGLVEDLGQEDIDSLFDIARLFYLVPLEGEARAELIEHQAYRCSECKPAEKALNEAEKAELSKINEAVAVALLAAAGQGGVS